MFIKLVISDTVVKWLSSGAVKYWLSLLHNFIQQCLNSVFVQVQLNEITVLLFVTPKEHFQNLLNKIFASDISLRPDNSLLPIHIQSKVSEEAKSFSLTFLQNSRYWLLNFYHVAPRIFWNIIFIMGMFIFVEIIFILFFCKINKTRDNQ